MSKRKKTRRLVPLMPILERLNACGAGMRLVAQMNARTFREAWDCPHVGHLAWLASEALEKSGETHRSAKCDNGFDWEEPTASSAWTGDPARSAADARRALEAIVSPAEVERALYDFAVREGLS